MTHRVAVTGLGAVTPNGIGVEPTWASLLRGESGIGPITCMNTEGFAVHFGGEVKGFDPETVVEKRDIGKLDRFVLLALAAAAEAIGDSGLTVETYGANRVGVVVGTGVGGLNTIEENLKNYFEKGARRISPFVVPKMMCNAAAGQISIRHGFKGPNFSAVTACASSNHSIGEAMRLIKFGFADAIVTGGAEAAITILGLGGFCSARALSTRADAPQRASRPFDRNRDGFVLSEGAGILVLENYDKAAARGARIYATLDGYGASGDAYHVTAPAEDGAGGAAAMSAALEEAGWNPSDVGYINTHGTSTPRGDAVETRVIHHVLGAHAKKTPVSSTKSCTGHTLGAAGGIEAVFTIKALETGTLPPTINYEEPDPECDLDVVPNEARAVKIQRALSNSLGFGGHNSVLAFSRT